MDRQNYPGVRWVIVYGDYNGVEAYAADEAYKLVQQYAPYILTVLPATTAAEELKGVHVLLIGTPRSNRHIASLVKEGTLALGSDEQAYAVKLDKSPFDEECQALVLAGNTPEGALYGLRDFQHEYVTAQLYRCEYYYDSYFKLFVDAMPAWEKVGQPAIERRGLWTWGHVIYDYKGYIDHMALWKMNVLTIWNDFAPLNAAEVVAYARSRGIGVVWGFSWCWGEKVDPGDPEALGRWTQRVIDTYESQYANLDGEGIYFQTFTEHEGARMNGKSTAELAVDWVNAIAAPLLARHPALRLQFGLHANGVVDDLPAFAGIDPRISIVWEDGGSFPFHYDPAKIDTIDVTVERLKLMASLRGQREDMGVIVKGGSILPWPRFEHQKGPFILGTGERRAMARHAADEETLYRYNQAQWMKNLDCLLRGIRAVAEGQAYQRLVQGLFEDSLWELKPWVPGALLAEAMWNPNRAADDIVALVAQSDDAHFA